MINIDYHRTHKNAYDWGMVCGIALPTLLDDEVIILVMNAYCNS
jgi:hypothetical protein